MCPHNSLSIKSQSAGPGQCQKAQSTALTGWPPVQRFLYRHYLGPAGFHSRLVCNLHSGIYRLANVGRRGTRHKWPLKENWHVGGLSARKNVAKWASQSPCCH